LPFSGGSSGQTGVSAHTHDSAVGNGGNLSSTITNLNDGSLFGMMVAMG